MLEGYKTKAAAAALAIVWVLQYLNIDLTSYMPLIAAVGLYGLYSKIERK